MRWRQHWLDGGCDSTSGSSFSNSRGSLKSGSFCVGYDSGMETPCGGRVRIGATSQTLSDASGMPRLRNEV